MSGNQRPYVRHYENHLLDDLHNFFPELLYGNIDQFRSVGDLLLYMRRQVRDRMDLFTSAAHSFQQRPRTYAPASSLAAPPAPPTPLVAAPPRIRLRTQEELVPNDIAMAADLLSLFTNPNMTTAAAPSLFSLLNLPMLAAAGGGGAAQTHPPANFLDPVVVRPTQQQITENTVIEIVDADEEVCAICQDEMPAGSQARTLHACDHRFHVGCIDTWFQRDVHCPVCRHDVREPAAVESEAAESTRQ